MKIQRKTSPLDALFSARAQCAWYDDHYNLNTRCAATIRDKTVIRYIANILKESKPCQAQ